MPRILSNTSLLTGMFPQETEKDAQCQLLHLIVVEDPKGIVDTMHYVDSNYDVTYANQVYTRFPLKFSGASISSNGTIDKASITVANATRILMPLIEAHDGLSGFTVSVLTVYEKFLDNVYTLTLDGTLVAEDNPTKDATAHIRDEYVIDSYSATEQTIAFQLNAVVDFDIRVPRRRFTPYSCYWRYKDPETCGYAGELTECKKSLEACDAHGNSFRFGGFPGIPSDMRRLYL